MPRRFQFSLRVAIVAMIFAGVAIGFYVRWPYYVAGRILDEAEGDKSFPAWQNLRRAIINRDDFRECVNLSNKDVTVTRVTTRFDEWGSQADVTVAITLIPGLVTKVWFIKLDKQTQEVDEIYCQKFEY